MSKSKIILDSWEANADSWVTTIENNELESRQLVTNDAIVNAVLQFAPQKVVDIGCGEGWLTRSLMQKGIQAWGADAIKKLVDDAIAKGGEFYCQLTYRQIADGAHKLPVPFDVAVINFALLDEEDTEALIHSARRLLTSTGRLVIQTLHPLSAATEGPYKSGWKEGSWAGMKQNFVQPYQWYFRTMADWIKLFTKAGFIVEELVEPLHPQTQKPLSVIFILQPR